MVVDFQHHYTPPELMETGKGDGSLRLDENGNPNYRFNPLLADLSAHVRMMDKAGIDVAVLSCGSGFDQPNFATCRLINDRMHQAEQDHPGRFIGLAHIPALNLRETEAELKRCAVELGFPGVVIASEVQGQPLDAPSLRPFWKAAADLGLYVFIHPPPQLIGWAHMDADDLVAHARLGIFADGSDGRLINSGLLDELPSLKIQVSHFGGGIARYLPRICGLQDREKSGTAHVPRHSRMPREPFNHYLQHRLFYDCAGWSAPIKPPSEAPNGCVSASRSCHPRKSYSQPTILRRSVRTMRLSHILRPWAGSGRKLGKFSMALMRRSSFRT